MIIEMIAIGVFLTLFALVISMAVINNDNPKYESVLVIPQSTIDTLLRKEDERDRPFSNIRVRAQYENLGIIEDDLREVVMSYLKDEGYNVKDPSSVRVGKIDEKTEWMYKNIIQKDDNGTKYADLGDYLSTTMHTIYRVDKEIND